MQELIYTSSQSGLKTGVSGYCSVAWTRGISVPLIEPLENLSGYQPLYLPGDPRCARNPVSFACQQVRYGSLHFTAVSRIAYAGLDYSNRSNKIAHHLVPEREDRLQDSFFGAAGALAIPDNFCTEWSGEPRLLTPRTLQLPPAPQDLLARTWAKYKGDAGFAGIIARRVEKLMRLPPGDPGAALFLAYPPEMPAADVLQMIFEVLQLLPQDLRKACTFNTYFIQQQLGVDCLIRALPEGSPLLSAMRRLSPAKVINLTGRESLPATADSLVEAARTGIAPENAVVPLPSPTIHLDFTPPPPEVHPLPEKAPVAVRAEEDLPEPVLLRIPPHPEPDAASMRKKWITVVGAIAIAVIFMGIVFAIRGLWLRLSPRQPESPPAVPAQREEIPFPAPEENGSGAWEPAEKEEEKTPEATPLPTPEPPPQIPPPQVPEAKAVPAGGAVPEPSKSPAAAKAPAPEPLTLQIDENLVPSLQGNREKTPEEEALLKKYREELAQLRFAIQKWHDKRNVWVEAERRRKNAEGQWRDAWRQSDWEQPVSMETFKKELAERQEQANNADKKERKERQQELQDWVTRDFPAAAAERKEWKNDFEEVKERFLTPPEKGRKKARPVCPKWLEDVGKNAEKAHQTLYPFFRKKKEAENREKDARKAMESAGRELLRSPLVGFCGLAPAFRKALEEYKPINRVDAAKRIQEAYSERMKKELQSEKMR